MFDTQSSLYEALTPVLGLGELRGHLTTAREFLETVRRALA
jgi:hypothetical protein